MTRRRADSPGLTPLVWVVLGAVLFLSGCSIGSPVPRVASTTCAGDSGCEWMTFAEMVDQWEETVAELAVPTGTALRPPERSDFGADAQQFSAHYGESIAHSQWFCLWQGALLEQSDPTSTEASAAVTHLRSFFETRTFREDYGGDVGIVSMVDDAAAGDTERLQRDHEANCPEATSVGR